MAGARAHGSGQQPMTMNYFAYVKSFSIESSTGLDFESSVALNTYGFSS